MNDEEIKAKIEELRPWWHYTKLPNGMEIKRECFDTHVEKDDITGVEGIIEDTTNEWNHPDRKWRLTEPFIPDDLTGKKCLDLGCNSGTFSIKLAQRGAEVLGIDINSRHIKQANFLKQFFLNEEQQKKCQFARSDMFFVEDKFDLILFMGLYYHLPDHTKALPFLNTLLNPDGVLIFETAIEDKCRWSGSNNPYDACIFVPTESYARDDIRYSGLQYWGGWEYNMKNAGQRRMYYLKKI